MKMGFRMRIYPTKEQEEALFYYCKISHNAWNFLVEKYKDNLPVISKYGIKDYAPNDLMRDMNVDIPQRILSGVIKTFSLSVQRIYNKHSFRVKFHKYNPNKQSFYVASTTFKVDKGYIKPPTNIGRIPASKCIKIDSDFFNSKNVSNIQEPHYKYINGEWFLCGCYNVDDVKKKESKNILGLDWGLKNFMTTSEGKFINYHKSIIREFFRIKKLQKVKDKKKNGSKNREKALRKLRLAYKRLDNLKRDFIEKETTLICKNYHVSVEDINNYDEIIKYDRYLMTINPYDRFIRKLQWKCEKYGSHFVKVNPAFTSQRCCKCRRLHQMPISKRTMECECGNILDRDINAAINIANDGRQVLLSMGVCCTY